MNSVDKKNEINKRLNNKKGLEESINRAINQSKLGMGRAHKEVWAEIIERYQLGAIKVK